MGVGEAGFCNGLIRVALATGNSPGQDISPHVNVTCT